jgi:hypothetical protein
MQEKGVEYEALEVDIKRYEEEFSKKATEFIEKELKSIGLVSEIKYQNMHSPKYYNFTNDSINVEVTLSKENINNIATYIKENVENFAEYIKKHYTSRPGFSSYYSNDVSDWTGELTDNLTNFGAKPIILGSILEFICENEGINSDGMYNYAIEQIPAFSYVSVKGETEEDVATETEGEEEIEEGIFTKGLKDKKEDLISDYWKKGGMWNRTINKKTNKPFVTKPSKEELSQILIDAEPDKYEGKIGHKDGKLIYVPSKDINWGTSSHGFGSGA